MYSCWVVVHRVESKIPREVTLFPVHDTCRDNFTMCEAKFIQFCVREKLEMKKKFTEANKMTERAQKKNKDCRAERPVERSPENQ